MHSQDRTRWLSSTADEIVSHSSLDWYLPLWGEHMDMVAVKARLTHLFWDWQAFLRVVIPGLWSWVISTLAGHLGPIIRHALFNNTSASRIRELGEDKWLLSHAPLPINKLLNVVVSIFASCGFALNESHYGGGSSNTAGVFSRWEIVFLGCVPGVLLAGYAYMFTYFILNFSLPRCIGCWLTLKTEPQRIFKDR